MGAKLRSHRFRRRLAWSGGFALVTGAVVAASILIGDTGQHYDNTLVNRPAWVYKTPPAANLNEAQRHELLDVMNRFIRTAVSRKHVASSYDLAGPDLRGGMSREEWRSGNIPVVPFPAAGIYDLTLDYSYVGDVAFDVAVIGDRGGIKTFLIEMKQSGTGAHAPWKVAAWVPKGVGGGSTPVAERHPEPVGPPPAFRGRLSPFWLLIPFGVLGMILVVPAAIGIRSWRQGRKAQREYEQERALPPLPSSYTSSSNPS